MKKYVCIRNNYAAPSRTKEEKELLSQIRPYSVPQLSTQGHISVSGPATDQRSKSMDGQSEQILSHGPRD